MLTNQALYLSLFGFNIAEVMYSYCYTIHFNY